MSNARPLIYLAFGAVLAAATAWCWTLLSDSREAAAAAAADLAEARRSAARIETARRVSPAQAGLRPERELRRRIDEAAEKADISAAGLEMIQEQSGRRVGNTGYEERPTQIVVRDVTLQQAITFFHVIAGGSPGVTIKSIRLVAPGEADTADRWMAEATVTYLAFTSRQVARGEAAGSAE